MKLPDASRRELEKTVGRMVSSLRENAHAIILYGSAVRGGFHPAFSDLNLLIVLKASTAPAHGVVRDAIATSSIRISPLIVELREMPRATRVFALKFLSIRRDYALLHGEDPLEELEVPKSLEILLAEQELRNLRMRLVNRFVTVGQNRERYLQFAVSMHSKVLITLSDALRTCDVQLPHNLDERDEIYARELGVDVGIVRELEACFDRAGGGRGRFTLDADRVHSRLIEILAKTLAWMETKHPELPL